MKKIITIFLTILCLLGYTHVYAEDTYTLTVIIEDRNTTLSKQVTSNDTIDGTVSKLIEDEYTKPKYGVGYYELINDNGKSYRLSLGYTLDSYKNYETNSDITRNSFKMFEDDGSKKKFNSDLTLYAHFNEVIYDIDFTVVPPAVGSITDGLEGSNTHWSGYAGYNTTNKPVVTSEYTVENTDYLIAATWRDLNKRFVDIHENFKDQTLPYDNYYQVYLGEFEEGKTYYGQVNLLLKSGYTFEDSYVDNIHEKAGYNVTLNGGKITYTHGSQSDITICFETQPVKHLVWQEDNGKQYWYENGTKQGTYSDPKGVIGDGTIRGREIYDPSSNAWYWLDAKYDGAKAVSKEVWMPYIYSNEDLLDDNSINNLANESDVYTESDIKAQMSSQIVKAIKNKEGKWVRYDENGKMYKGWVTLENWQEKPEQNGNTYYYDYRTGLMAKGETIIDGKTYFFDEITGVLRGNR